MRPDGLLSGLRWSDLRVIAATWMRFAMRSGGGVISLFLILVIGLFLVNFWVGQAQNILDVGNSMGRELASDEEIDASLEKKAKQLSSFTGTVIDFVMDGEGEEKKREREFLTEERPAVLSMTILLLMYLIPFAACSAGFNQTASDIGNRGLRFLLSRTERPNIFLGRFLAAATFMVFAILFLIIGVTLYIMLRFPIYETGNVVLGAIEGYLTLFVFSLPFLALSSWVSSTQRSPFAALAICYALAAVPWWVIKFVVNTGKNFNVDLEWARLLTPWDWRQGLLSYDTVGRVQCHAALIGFTVVFLLLGLMNFRKRDL